MAQDKNLFPKYLALLHSGKVQEAALLKQEVLSTLTKSKMTVVSEVGGGSEGGGKFVRFSDGTIGVWKPERVAGGKLKNTLSAPYEVAAYQLDQFLGLHRVPMTVERELDGQKGTVQLLVANLKQKRRLGNPNETRLFDYLIANLDRHGDNYLITEDGQIVAIDHGLAFRAQLSPSEFKSEIRGLLKKDSTDAETRTQKLIRELRMKNPGQKLPEETINAFRDAEAKRVRAQVLQDLSAIIGEKTQYERIKNAKDGEFRDLLKRYLNEEQIQALLERRQAIVEAVEEARKALGDDVFRSGRASPVREVYFENLFPGSRR